VDEPPCSTRPAAKLGRRTNGIRPCPAAGRQLASTRRLVESPNEQGGPRQGGKGGKTGEPSAGHELIEKPIRRGPLHSRLSKSSGGIQRQRRGRGGGMGGILEPMANQTL